MRVVTHKSWLRLSLCNPEQSALQVEAVWREDLERLELTTLLAGDDAGSGNTRTRGFASHLAPCGGAGFQCLTPGWSKHCEHRAASRVAHRPHTYSDHICFCHEPDDRHQPYATAARGPGGDREADSSQALPAPPPQSSDRKRVRVNIKERKTVPMAEGSFTE